MRRDERARAIEDTDAFAFEPRELPDPVLDPVQPRLDVDAADRDVAGDECRERLRRGQDLDVRLRTRERDVCGGASMSDEGDGHRTLNCAGSPAFLHENS